MSGGGARIFPLPGTPGVRERARVRELRDRARRLRREQTDAERTLWRRLRARELAGVKFRRQYVIDSFIVDFCCPEHKLVVEVDGGQHAMSAKADERRTAFLAQRGYRVLRFWDHDVLTNGDAVLQQIMAALIDPHPSPLPEGRG